MQDFNILFEDNEHYNEVFEDFVDSFATMISEVIFSFREDSDERYDLTGYVSLSDVLNVVADFSKTIEKGFGKYELQQKCLKMREENDLNYCYNEWDYDTIRRHGRGDDKYLVINYVPDPFIEVCLWATYVYYCILINLHPKNKNYVRHAEVIYKVFDWFIRYGAENNYLMELTSEIVDNVIFDYKIEAPKEDEIVLNISEFESLKEQVENLKAENERLNLLVEATEITASSHDRLRMETLLLLLEKIGADDTISGNKRKIAELMSYIIGNNYQSCANHFSNRKFSKTEHAEEIEKVNRKMSEIGLDVKLSV